ncbi:DUF3619 family protein [Azoarcus sp. TTM-91]|uniref:DUF3619 family protein n=1 Tax=Azoarcus sp. TTM-91 TaxID=2691581 RepID=UPI00145DC24C|nr:DUF3619 family protein [Azoarcus sp. TTM-91]NMG33591.1 DUF3619 family protein [Azoarcus sp. TTM-91]
MNERVIKVTGDADDGVAFARRIAAHLTVAAHEVDADTLARLRAARQRALAAHRPRSGLLGRIAAWVRAGVSPAAVLRQAGAVAAVLAVVAIGDMWATSVRLAELEEIDAALLVDELPIDAYLDEDFGAWLRHATQS